MVVDEQNSDSHRVRLKSEAQAGPPPELDRDVFRVRPHPVHASLVTVISRHGARIQDTAGSTVCAFIVTDDAAMRRGLTLRLDAEPDLTVTGTAASLAQAPADAGMPTVVVVGVHRGDPAVSDATPDLCTRPEGPSLVLFGLDSVRTQSTDGRSSQCMTVTPLSLRAIRHAAATHRNALGAATGRAPSASA